MIVIVLTITGALVGAILFGGFGGGIWSGAALGALAGWLIRLQGRLQALEREFSDREREDFRERRPEPGRPPVSRRVSIYEPEAAPAPIEEPEPGREAPAPVPDAEFPQDAAARQSADQGARRTGGTDRPATSGPRFESEPAEPLLIDRMIETVKDWCTTGNVPVKVGVVLSVFGVGFLVKEAIDRSWLFLPLSLRRIGVALFGIALLIFGWRLRESKPVFALSIQGGGIAVLYLTTYAAFAIYGLIPSALAFVLLVIVTAAAGVLAVLQDARAFAVLGIVGGFMAPVLTSDGSGNHVLLFGYYAVLNAAVFGIAWFKAWRVLNLLGFVFTFGVGALWGYTGYRPEHFASTEPFLVLFVAMYTIIPILFASQETPRIEGYVDGTLVFGTPIAGFGLQSQLVADTQYGLALSAIAWALMYVGLATYLLRRRTENLRVLTEAFLGLGIVFVGIAIPLALDARWTSVAWSLQGAAMIWLGWRQQRSLALLAGIVLQGLAAAAFTRQPFASGDAIAILNGYYLGALVIALAAWFSAWVFDRLNPGADNAVFGVVAWLLTAWATAWWIGAGFVEIERALPDSWLVSAPLIFLAATTVLALLAAARINWSRLNGIGVLLTPALALGLAGAALFQEHPLADHGWIGWPIAFAVHWVFLHRCEARFARIKSAWHPLGHWLLTLFVALEVEWWVDRVADGVWPEAAVLAVAAVMVLATLRLRDYLRWPLAAQATSYVTVGCGGIVAVGLIGMLAANLGSAGDPSPLPYVPILNPLELVSCLTVVTALRWYAAAQAESRIDVASPAAKVLVPVALALFLLTMVVARTVHHWTGVPFDPERLAGSDVFQAALSIAWGTSALLGMIVGAGTRCRALWIGGAALMAVVVVKLFLVELDNTGTVERVVSFLGVGLLLLVVGYFAPVPPREPGGEDDEVAEVQR